MPTIHGSLWQKHFWPEFFFGINILSIHEGVFCRTVSWDAAQSALCSSASLWWEVARANQKGCSACRPRTLSPSLSHFRGSWLTAFAAPAGTPVVLSWSACRTSSKFSQGQADRHEVLNSRASTPGGHGSGAG